MDGTIDDFNLVINCAAWTDVDGAENPANRADVFRVNADGPQILAEACLKYGAKLIHLSTDYVFNGTDARIYRENDPTSPANVYGESKAVGEEAVLSILPEAGYVVRTAWLYGDSRGFVPKVLQLGFRDRTTAIDVPYDQMGHPTYAGSVAQRLALMVKLVLGGQSVQAGIYHAVSRDPVTRHLLAWTAFQKAGLDPGRVRAVATPSAPAHRPNYTVLGQDRWLDVGLTHMPNWEDMLTTAMPKILDKIKDQ
jgi:dTDP-4-dehydrorhamnose reductase